MALILNTILPDNKRCTIALNEIYGLGNNLAEQICEQLGISHNIRCKNLKNHQIDRLTQCIAQNYLTAKHLREKTSENKQHLISINSYRGFRYIERLPCRGQRTHGNAQTARKNTAPAVNRKDHGLSINNKKRNYLQKPKRNRP